MGLYTVFIILIVHWIADFILQTDEQAKNKSKSMGYLLSHTATYTLFVTMALTVYAIIFSVPLYIVALAGGITWVAHSITDYFTSRLVNKLYFKGDVHNMFVVIGADQILHYIQLFLTWQLLIQ